jgi:hypothetical protein
MSNEFIHDPYLMAAKLYEESKQNPTSSFHKKTLFGN